jgi:hypothetical protein
VKVAGIEGINAGFRTAPAKLLLLRYRFEAEAQLQLMQKFSQPEETSTENSESAEKCH